MYIPFKTIYYFYIKESLVDIEYIEKQQAPEPEDSLVHDDWVSCIQGCKDW